MSLHLVDIAETAVATALCGMAIVGLKSKKRLLRWRGCRVPSGGSPDGTDAFKLHLIQTHSWCSGNGTVPLSVHYEA